MIDDFPCERQETEWVCLPTAVQSVLRYQGVSPSIEQVKQYCRAFPNGACKWDDSLTELAQHFDIERLDGDWESIVEAVTFNDEPVIVTIADPFPLEPLVGDHAVVVVGVTDNPAQVHYMDPASGTIEQMPADEFLQWWDVFRSRAFICRPA